ncbi:MAG: hypothetical protein AAF376_11470 [Pseudomonadota bacterium]
MRAFVSELPLGEPARFNPAQLEALCARVGEVRAETEVAFALDRISTQLMALTPTANGGDGKELQVLLRKLVDDANLIGMATLARVAQDVLNCLATGDATAFAATFARLDRVGDRSIHAVWDLEDLPM